ncbi:MAG: hypothetical protein NT016_00920, partial [Candidatus Aenigmarchaeota archaeon]|nr:hypothetical protein [Candidatus Aenigmarchaeota archaeon]
MASAALALACVLALSMFPSASLAELTQLRNPSMKFYNVDVQLAEDGRSAVQMVMTFVKPETSFAFNVLGRVENFNASSNSGPVDCMVSVSGTSEINCSMDLTAMEKELRISFETADFVKALDSKFYFSADFTPHAYVDTSVVSLRLPPSALLSGEDISSSILSYLDKASEHITSGNILINWDMSQIAAADQLKFEVLYENVATPP